MIEGSQNNSVSGGIVGATISGGGATNYGSVSYTNRVTADFGTVGGGAANTASGIDATIGGGFGNKATFQGTTISGGFNNTANNSWAVVGGGTANTGAGFNSVVGGGNGNYAGGQGSTIGGGFGNTNGGSYATIAGGDSNIATGTSAFVGGGGFDGLTFSPNIASGLGSVSVGGVNNRATNTYATVPGGATNLAGGAFSFAAGQQAQALHAGSFVWADSQNASFSSTAVDQFNVRAKGGINLFTSGGGMGIDGQIRINSGGFSQSSADNFYIDAPFIGGGRFSVLTNGNVGIGIGNPGTTLHVYTASNPAVIRIQSTGTPGFGRIEFQSNPQGDAGEWRPAYIQSLDGGGFTGGLGFYLNGSGVGTRFGTNEVMRLINGNVGIGTNNPTQRLHVNGNILASGTITGSSDRNVKENFKPIDASEVLDKVTALPITRWSYKADVGVTHLGPMAQDFYAAFDIGMDDKHISMVDADGVALAAIQGLNEKVSNT